MPNANIKEQLAIYTRKVQQLEAKSTRPELPPAFSPTAFEKEMFSVAREAIKEWEASEQGKATLLSMQHMSLEEVPSALQSVLQDGAFGKLLQFIKDHARLESLLKSFVIESISVAVKFEIEVVVGFSGTLGLAFGVDLSGVVSGTAINLKNLKGEGVAYLCLSLDAGVDAGAFTGVEIGFWATSPEGLAGKSYGGQLTIDDPVGGSLGIALSPSFGVTVAAVAGADDGAEFTASYTFLLASTTVQIPNVYQPNTTHFVILTHIECVNKNSHDNNDEVYFTFTTYEDSNDTTGTTYRYPQWDYRSMNDDGKENKDHNGLTENTLNNTWNTGRSIKFGDRFSITIYDADPGGNDDALLTFTMNYTDICQLSSGRKTATTKNGVNEITYDLYFTPVY